MKWPFQKRDNQSTYEGLRSQALSWTAQSLGLDITGQEPFGVVMESDIGAHSKDLKANDSDRSQTSGKYCTVVAIADGTASMYMSQGTTFLGAGKLISDPCS